MKVVWLSAGVSSFIAGYLAKDVDEWIYIDVDDQHPDSLRFIRDCEKVIGKEVTVLHSLYYTGVESVCRAVRYVNGPTGAPCTRLLKKAVRKRWELDHMTEDLTYVWGMDCNERHRAERIISGFPQVKHEFPLIDRNLTKEDAHGICKQLGITEMPCIRLDHLTDEQRKEYSIRHNRSAEFSTWDFKLLAEEIEKLEAEGMDMSTLDFRLDRGEETPMILDGSGAVEYGEEAFGDDKFNCECPVCGFRFNEK